MKIVITGTPGTGKSSVAKELAKASRTPLISIAEFVKEKGLLEVGEEVDVEKLEKELNKRLEEEKAGGWIVEGHLACEIKLPADYVFVLRANPDVLRKRLKKRGYSEKKIEENLLVEMLDYCTQRASVNYPESIVVELETGGASVKQSAGRIIDAMAKNKKKIDDIDYSKYLEEYVRSKFKPGVGADDGEKGKKAY